MKRLRLNCNRCGSFVEYRRKTGDPSTVVRCESCGKKHSDDSVFMVDANHDYDRDESGALIESPY